MSVPVASRPALWTGRILSTLAGLPFVMSAGMKLVPNEQVTQGMAHLGWPAGALMTLAVLEGGSVLLYWTPRVAVLGAIVLTGYLGGAIASYVRLGEPFPFPLVTCLLLWAGIYLREERLRSLLPLRR